MSNFKPGDKAIYVGPEYSLHPFREVFGIKYGETVVLGRRYKSPIDGSTAYNLYDQNGRPTPCGTREINLRKPDTYDITAQDWYQKILRGEQVEETV